MGHPTGHNWHILAHGLNSVSSLALDFGHGLALDFDQTIGNAETDSSITHCTLRYKSKKTIEMWLCSTVKLYRDWCTAGWAKQSVCAKNIVAPLI